MGCRTVRHSSWKKLNELGVMTAEFFPAIFRRFQIRMNYRNHRKIVIIDNKLAYVGGFNIGREYIGLDDKFGYWRDTHLKIEGGAVASLHLRFLLDWNYASKENLFLDNNYFTDAVPCEDGHCDMQIISSGPDNASQQIRSEERRVGKEC